MNQEVTRKAILIGSPGMESNYLHGVKEDLNNLENFLLSRKGGSFYPNEVIKLHNPSYKKLAEIVKSSITDYLFIYFSGHGFTDDKGFRNIALPDYNLQDLQLLNGSPRQIVIIDACRNYLPSIGSIPDSSTEFSNFSGSSQEERKLFDRYIKSSPHGQMIIHSTQKGQYSYDTRYGGVFTNAFLKVSTNIKVEKEFRSASIKTVLNHTKQVLRSQGSHQVPEITYESGSLNLQFAIGVSKPLFVINNPRVQVQQNSNNGWIGAGLLGVVLLGIAFSD
jgi:hypothetical protein